MQGYPSPEWLRILGAHFRVDPEFYHQHLSFLQPKDHFDLPTLPSGSRNIFRLRITTIGSRLVPCGTREVEENRKLDAEVVRGHQRALGLKGMVGDSIVRRYSVHDETWYTLEQEISCCVTKHGRG